MTAAAVNRLQPCNSWRPNRRYRVHFYTHERRGPDQLTSKERDITDEGEATSYVASNTTTTYTEHATLLPSHSIVYYQTMEL